jgi:penicillin-binding protein 2
MIKNHKRRILGGDTANMAIGQGVVLASPLQVAQAMAGIANGGALPKLQLIRQVQDTRGRVVQAFTPDRRNWLGLDPKAVDVVRRGMYEVVNEGGGTAQRAKLSYSTICGKTGTGQWGPEDKVQRVGWFAGFLSYENPRYAFAVLYEGKPNEKVSGGRTAAPMIHDFFEAIKDDIKDDIAPPMKAVVVVNEAQPAVPEGEGAVADPAGEAPLRALPVDPLELENGGAEEPESTPPPAPPALRAMPVGEDEVIEEDLREPEDTDDSSPQRAVPVDSGEEAENPDEQP